MNAPFGLQIVLYLFLAGVAAGSAFIASLMLHRSDPNAFVTGKRSLLLAIGAISVGIVCLVSDLVDPGNFLLILTEANPQSAISWGARIVTAFTLVAIFCWALYRHRTTGSATAGECAALWLLRLLALALAIYPGFVLWQGEANTLWKSWLIVPLIALSGLHAGFAATTLLVGEEPIFPFSRRTVETVLIIALLLVAIGFLLSQQLPPQHLFAYLFLLLAIVLPLALPWRQANNPGIEASLCVLIGSFFLRAWLITDGQSLFF